MNPQYLQETLPLPLRTIPFNSIDKLEERLEMLKKLNQNK